MCLQFEETAFYDRMVLLILLEPSEKAQWENVCGVQGINSFITSMEFFTSMNSSMLLKATLLYIGFTTLISLQ